MKTFIDLLRFSPSFRYGFIILLFVLILLSLSFFSPYAPQQTQGCASQ
ncbi:MAG: hypothetical protein R2865_16060 [Deinococcales bacterium]